MNNKTIEIVLKTGLAALGILAAINTKKSIDETRKSIYEENIRKMKYDE